MYLCYNQATVYLFVAICNHLPETYHCAPAPTHIPLPPLSVQHIKATDALSSRDSTSRVCLFVRVCALSLCSSALTGWAWWETKGCCSAATKGLPGKWKKYQNTQMFIFWHICVSSLWTFQWKSECNLPQMCHSFGCVATKDINILPCRPPFPFPHHHHQHLHLRPSDPSCALDLTTLSPFTTCTSCYKNTIFSRKRKTNQALQTGYNCVVLHCGRWKREIWGQV